MNSSYNGQPNIVLTRKLTLSDKQRRKQLIAEAAKSSKQSYKISPLKQESTHYKNNKAFGCFGGGDDNYTNVKDKCDKTDHSTKSCTSIPSIDLMDTGNDKSTLTFIYKLV